MHPSVAQKYENLTVPDQDYRGDGGAQSNQIWRLPPGFVTCLRVGIIMLNQHVSWIPVRLHSPVTLFQFWRVLMHAFKLTVSPLAITSTRITPSVSQKTVIMTFLAERELSWTSFFSVTAGDATPLTVFSSTHNGEPRFCYLWRSGTKGLFLSITTLQQFRIDSVQFIISTSSHIRFIGK